MGVSPVCILGVNINRGQEISLRLRTDDLRGGWLLLDSGERGSSGRVAAGCGSRRTGTSMQRSRLHRLAANLTLRTPSLPLLPGFRRYDRIKETLLHELAHMVWGEHDNSFKELNSQVLGVGFAFGGGSGGSGGASTQSGSRQPCAVQQRGTPSK